MKKILVFLLAIAVSFCTCACGNAADENEESYISAVQLMENDAYVEAIDALTKLGSYEDSAQLLEECKSEAYLYALDRLFYGDCEEAIAVFTALRDYEDSVQMVEECKLTKTYQEADDLFYEEQYEQAYALFKELGDFEDSPDRVKKCEIELTYAEAVALFKNGSYAEAQLVFESIADEKDVGDYLDLCDEIKELVRSPLFETLQKMMGIDYLKQELDTVYSDAEGVYISLSNSQLIGSEYVFEMGDGSMLQLPMTYEDLCNAGWVLEYGMEEDGLSDPLPDEEYVWCSFINADGKTINAEIGNHSSEPIDLREAAITQLQVGGVDTESFSVNGISRGATIVEIVTKFGLPYGSSYYRWESGGEAFSFYYIDESNYCSIDFSIDPETWLLDSICYCGPLYPDELPE